MLTLSKTPAFLISAVIQYLAFDVLFFYVEAFLSLCEYVRGWPLTLMSLCLGSSDYVLFLFICLCSMSHLRYIYEVRHNSKQVSWISSGQGSRRCLHWCLADWAPVLSQQTDHESQCMLQSVFHSKGRTRWYDVPAVQYWPVSLSLVLSPHRKWPYCPSERKWPGADH